MNRRLRKANILVRLFRALKLKISEFLNVITGISTSVFGLSLNRKETDYQVAYRVISYLENKRVLFVSYDLEVDHECLKSAFQIREYITNELNNIYPNSKLAPKLKSIRAACRKYISRHQLFNTDLLFQERPLSDYREEFKQLIEKDYTFKFDSKFFINRRPTVNIDHYLLGELRGVIGLQVAEIANLFNLDLEDELATILPIADDK